jgi:hypothetical protein
LAAFTSVLGALLAHRSNLRKPVGAVAGVATFGEESFEGARIATDGG